VEQILLDGADGQSQFVGDFLVALRRLNELHDLFFTKREMRIRRSAFLLCGSPTAWARVLPADGAKGPAASGTCLWRQNDWKVPAILRHGWLLLSWFRLLRSDRAAFDRKPIFRYKCTRISNQR
jgi:hypothetical protein